RRSFRSSHFPDEQIGEGPRGRREFAPPAVDDTHGPHQTLVAERERHERAGADLVSHRVFGHDRDPEARFDGTLDGLYVVEFRRDPYRHAMAPERAVDRAPR